MSGFDEVNADIRTGGGGYVTLQRVGDETAGVLVDVVTRQMRYKGELVKSKKTGEVRKEWVFTLETDKGVVKVTARENIQIATKEAMAKAKVSKLEKGAYMSFKVTEDSVRGEKSAEVDVNYTPPKFESLPDDDEAPF